MLRYCLLVALCIASAQAGGYDGYGHGSASLGYGDVLGNGQNYEVNYSGPKANPIVAKYAPASYGHDNVYGYGKANGHGSGYGDYSYAHGDVLGNGQNYEVNYSGPKANPIVAKYAPASYGHDNVYGYGKANGHGSGYGDYSYAHGDVLGNGQNYEVNYSGPKANPIVAKYAPASYGHDNVYGYGKVNGHGSGYGDYSYAHSDVLGNGQNYEVNYSGPKANPIVAKYAPASYGHGNAYGRDGVVYGHGGVVYGSGDLGYGHGGYALHSGNKGYGYAKELPTVAGVGYAAESKPTGFLYKNARYIEHGSPYVPYTAHYKKAYKKLSGYSDL